MKSIRTILVATTVLPAMMLAQPGAGFAQLSPGSLQMAQAGGPRKEEEAKPAPHQEAPRPAPARPAAVAPPRAETPHPAPPRAEVQRPAEVPRRAEQEAPRAKQPEPARPAPVPRAETPKPVPQAERPAPAHAEAPKQAPAPARPAEAQRPVTPPPSPAPQAAPARPVNAERPATPLRPAEPGRPAEAARPISPPAPGQPPAQAARPAGAPAGQPAANQAAPAQAAPNQPAANAGRPGGRPGAGAIAAGVAAGLAGGFIAATAARNLGDIQRDRRESHEDGIDFIREPGRTIIGEGGHSFIVHDENERFRDLGYNVRTEQRGNDFVAFYREPGGDEILTFTDPQGRLLRRVRRTRDGREIVLIDNSYDGYVRNYTDDIVVLPPPPIGIPPSQYAVEYDGATEDMLYDTFMAAPVQALPQRYTLDQVLYSPDLRARMRSVDINTLNFDTGSWIVEPGQVVKLRALAEAIKKVVARNPNEVFLVEGFTDGVGKASDNLSLSDRRAQSVAALLTREFKVPPENLTTQGYGAQYPKEQTPGASRINRRVTVQRITPLLAEAGQAPPPK